MSSAAQFVHLRVHSEYSLLQGAIRLKSLPELCIEADMPAVAVTDKNNLFCALEFSVAASSKGVQPIIGCQIDIQYTDPKVGDSLPKVAPIILIAQSERGYQNLMKLNSCLYLDEEKRGFPRLDLTQLKDHSDDLICLSGGPDGPIGSLIEEGQIDKATDYAANLLEIFDDRFYIELQRHPEEGGLPVREQQTEPIFLQIAYEMDIPIVATNDVHFLNPEAFESHDALLCIADGVYVDQQEPRRRLTRQHYFKNPKEMLALFADLPEAVENTVEIAQRCSFMVSCRDPILPKFADDEVAELRRQANEGLQKRLQVIPHAVSVEEYKKRLDFELNVIINMGFPGYFLIVADFIQWAKKNKIPVGPGRGSGAGSLVAYSLTITDLDPIRYSLLFERFLNPDRVSMPDFDIDFCMDRREEVIRYVQEKYGYDRVGQIITFGALLSKAAIRDIGRVLQMPYGQVDRLAKMIPVEGVKPVSIEKAIEEEPRLKEEARNEEVVERLLNYGKEVEGLLRNAATHAAGVVIGDRPLDSLVPLYKDQKSDMPATQYNMKWVEQSGLVKFDFLGLKTLTVIQNAVELILKSGRALHVNADGQELYVPQSGAENEINAIPLDDEATYQLYSSAKTYAVFQVESQGMMDALKRMKPTSIEDIVALVALYRPGPMENIPAYCEVKNGLKERTSIHPLIDDILEETQGIIVYQEQVMQIAQVMAGYSLGEADLLRRAMGKKIKEAMDAERPKFEKGSAENGVDTKKASEIFDLLEKFANYGFNKSHAAAYAVVSYQTAWLKTNHPLEFMAGVMNCDIHLTDKLATYFEKVVKKELELSYVSPCINKSFATFSVVDGSLVYGLGALKNVGIEAMQLIVEARNSTPFSTLFDFARRVDLKRIGKRPLEMLVRAGAFDELDNNRKRVFEALEDLVNYSVAVHEQKSSNQVSLFGETGDDLPEPRIKDFQDWLPVERLAEEYIAIGFYLSDHPLGDYATALKRNGVLTLDEVVSKAKAGPFVAKMAGVVANRQERKSARGNRFAFLQLSDKTGSYEATLFSEVLEKSREYLETGSKVLLTAEASLESDQIKLLARSISPLDAGISNVDAEGMRIFVNDENAISSVASVLDQSKDQVKLGAKGPIYLRLINSSLPGEVEIDLGESFPINPQIRGAIKSLNGVVEVEEM
jgi:DNA polymerase-3 subunit alpha